MTIKPSRLLLMLGLAVPSVFLSTVGGASAKPIASSESPTLSKENQTFIKVESRRDTLRNLNQLPINIRANDGGTGKEASDKGKDACDKCKESCDACQVNPADRVILPADRLNLPTKLQTSPLKSLIQTDKPIF
ncbi:MAG: hypothetical protein KME17_03285 [Cyanosarcina radialis HA8281-LM2]|nr:hypothetical protein [Cyanosarcina radialis HA8281-LM2]